MGIKIMSSNGGSVTVEAPASGTSGGSDFTLVLPTGRGSANQVLKVDNSGKLRFEAESGGDPPFASGTRMVFHNASAPTGWTKDTTARNTALRCVGGANAAALTSGGDTDFSTVFGSSVSTNAHTLTESEIPSHTHPVSNLNTNVTLGSGCGRSCISQPIGNTSGNTSSTGGGQGHSHTMAMNIKFMDIIICQAD